MPNDTFDWKKRLLAVGRDYGTFANSTVAIQQDKYHNARLIFNLLPPHVQRTTTFQKIFKVLSNQAPLQLNPRDVVLIRKEMSDLNRMTAEGFQLSFAEKIAGIYEKLKTYAAQNQSETEQIETITGLKIV